MIQSGVHQKSQVFTVHYSACCCNEALKLHFHSTPRCQEGVLTFNTEVSVRVLSSSAAFSEMIIQTIGSQLEGVVEAPNLYIVPLKNLPT